MSSILSATCRLSRNPLIFNALRNPQNKLWRHFSSAVEPKPTPTTEKPMNLHTPGARSHPVDNLEKRMLVWCGKYKTVEEVPNMVNQEVMEKVRNKVRIRMANIMMALTAIGCIFMIWSGKKAAGRGESVQKANIEWHREYNEKAAADALASKK